MADENEIERFKKCESNEPEDAKNSKDKDKDMAKEPLKDYYPFNQRQKHTMLKRVLEADLDLKE